MIIRLIVVIIEILMFYLLQSTVFPSIALAGVVPDLLMILVVTIAFTRGRTKGMLTGLLCGLIVDFCFGNFVGLLGLMYMIIGYLAGFSNKIYDENDYTLPMILIGVSELIYNLMYYIFYFLLRGKLNIGYYFYRFMIPKIIYTVLLGIIVYKLLNMQHLALQRFDRDQE